MDCSCQYLLILLGFLTWHWSKKIKSPLLPCTTTVQTLEGTLLYSHSNTMQQAMVCCTGLCCVLLYWAGPGLCWAVPLRCGVLAVEGVLELNDVAVPLAQQVVLLGVVLHQLGQRGKLLPAIQIVVVPRVLDLNVGDLIITPTNRADREREREKERERESVREGGYRESVVYYV